MNCRLCDAAIWERHFRHKGNDYAICLRCAKEIYDEYLIIEMSEPELLDELYVAVHESWLESYAYSHPPVSA